MNSVVFSNSNLPYFTDYFANNCVSYEELHGRYKIIKQLFNSNRINELKDYIKTININAESGMKDSLLSMFVFRSDVEIVNFLIENGADYNTTYEHGGTTIFELAFSLGNLTILEKLLKKKVNPNIILTTQNTALFNACGENWLEGVKLLLNYGADPNIPDHRGKRPLAVACAKGNKEIALLLFSKGADPYVTDLNGKSLLSTIENMWGSLQNLGGIEEKRFSTLERA